MFTFLFIIIFMVLLKHTGICSPCVMMLILINMADVEISLVRGNVLHEQVSCFSIASWLFLVGNFSHFNFAVSLCLGLKQVNFLRIFASVNLIELDWGHLVFIKCLLILLSVEARYLMCIHRPNISQVMDEANHCLVTVGVELVFGWNTSLIKLFQQSINFLEFNKSILSDVFSNFISEIGSESQVVFKLYVNGLIVVVQPLTLHRFFAVCGITILAKSCFSGIVRSDHYLPDVLFGETPVVFIINDLNSIWHLMGAYFFFLKQI